MNEWKTARLDSFRNEKMKEWKNEWKNERMNERMKKWMKEWKNEWNGGEYHYPTGDSSLFVAFSYY